MHHGVPDRPSGCRPFLTRGLNALYDLTDAETKICALIVDGLTEQEIARAGHVSPEMVKSHVHSLLSNNGTANG